MFSIYLLVLIFLNPSTVAIIPVKRAKTPPPNDNHFGIGLLIIFESLGGSSLGLKIDFCLLTFQKPERYFSGNLSRI